VFQTWGPATEKTLLPTVESLTAGTELAGSGYLTQAENILKHRLYLMAGCYHGLTEYSGKKVEQSATGSDVINSIVIIQIPT